MSHTKLDLFKGNKEVGNLMFLWIVFLAGASFTVSLAVTGAPFTLPTDDGLLSYLQNLLNANVGATLMMCYFSVRELAGDSRYQAKELEDALKPRSIDFAIYDQRLIRGDEEDERNPVRWVLVGTVQIPLKGHPIAATRDGRTLSVQRYNPEVHDPMLRASRYYKHGINHDTGLFVVEIFKENHYFEQV